MQILLKEALSPSSSSESAGPLIGPGQVGGSPIIKLGENLLLSPHCDFPPIFGFPKSRRFSTQPPAIRGGFRDHGLALGCTPRVHRAGQMETPLKSELISKSSKYPASTCNIRNSAKSIYHSFLAPIDVSVYVNDVWTQLLHSEFNISRYGTCYL